METRLKRISKYARIAVAVSGAILGLPKIAAEAGVLLVLPEWLTHLAAYAGAIATAFYSVATKLIADEQPTQ